MLNISSKHASNIFLFQTNTSENKILNYYGTHTIKREKDKKTTTLPLKSIKYSGFFINFGSNQHVRKEVERAIWKYGKVFSGLLETNDF